MTAGDAIWPYMGSMGWWIVLWWIAAIVVLIVHMQIRSDPLRDC
jgi:hypothetical protein